MMHIDVTFEDTRLIADNPTAGYFDRWVIALHDNPTGRSDSRVITDDQLAAILFLAIKGDEHPLSSLLYPMAETGLIGVPPELRPIP